MLRLLDILNQKKEITDEDLAEGSLLRRQFQDIPETQTVLLLAKACADQGLVRIELDDRFIFDLSKGNLRQLVPAFMQATGRKISKRLGKKPVSIYASDKGYALSLTEAGRALGLRPN